MNGCGRTAIQRRKWCFDHLLRFLRRASHVTDDTRALLRTHQSRSSCSINPLIPPQLLQCQLEPLPHFDYLRRTWRDWRKVLEQLTPLRRRQCSSITAPLCGQGEGLHTPGGFLATSRSQSPNVCFFCGDIIIRVVQICSHITFRVLCSHFRETGLELSLCMANSI